MSISENVKQIQDNITAAAKRAGRDPAEIMLCAATKMNDASRVREAIAGGITVCGENRAQELLEKHAQGAYDGASLHFIGHLQKNKVRQLVGKAELICSVDSLELIEEIQKRAQAAGLVQDILIEINIGGEEAKSGIAPDTLDAMLEKMGQFDCVRVLGLMAIPPICAVPEENRIYFRRMKQLFVDIGRKKYDNNNVCMKILSMGMSADYEIAVEEGSNLVRVGTAIFGARNYTDRGGTANVTV